MYLLAVTSYVIIYIRFIKIHNITFMYKCIYDSNFVFSHRIYIGIIVINDFRTARIAGPR